jgi:hypothetical protein
MMTTLVEQQNISFKLASDKGHTRMAPMASAMMNGHSRKSSDRF